MFWVILPALVFAILIPFSDKVSHKEVRRHAISKPFSWLWLLVLISLKILWVKFYSPNLGNQWTKAEQKRGGLELTNVRRAFCARVCVFRARAAWARAFNMPRTWATFTCTLRKSGTGPISRHANQTRELLEYCIGTNHTLPRICRTFLGCKTRF